MALHNLGSIGFFSTYRPPLPLDLFSLSTPPYSPQNEAQISIWPPPAHRDEVHLTDGMSYNYNGHAIPPAALKAMLKRPMLAHVATEADVDSGRLSGLLLVSERAQGLETLHIALRLNEDRPIVLSFAHVYGTYNDVRMEDSGIIAGEYLVYVTTKDPAPARRQPWTAVYKTHLGTGETQRLTPEGIADLSPAVSPDGTKLAVASFQGKEGGWQGEIEDLKTNIFVFDICRKQDYNHDHNHDHNHQLGQEYSRNSNTSSSQPTSRAPDKTMVNFNEPSTSYKTPKLSNQQSMKSKTKGDKLS